MRTPYSGVGKLALGTFGAIDRKGWLLAKLVTGYLVVFANCLCRHERALAPPRKSTGS
jgi:hypothetical protein